MHRVFEFTLRVHLAKPNSPNNNVKAQQCYRHISGVTFAPLTHITASSKDQEELEFIPLHSFVFFYSVNVIIQRFIVCERKLFSCLRGSGKTILWLKVTVKMKHDLTQNA